MFLKFDGIGAGEDMIVVLKLYDPNTNTYTTRAIMVENGDIQKGPGAGPGIYSGITLDNNDGLVIIESNDYNQPGRELGDRRRADCGFRRRASPARRSTSTCDRRRGR